MQFDVAGPTLGGLVSLVRGNTYKSAMLGQPGPVLLGLASIQRDGGFRGDSLKTYGGESADKLLLRPGDLYVSLKDVTQSGDLLGAVARLPKSIAVGRLTQDTVKLVFDSAHYPPALLYWVLRAPEYRSYCRERAIGTTNLSLSRDDFLAFQLPAATKARMELVIALETIEQRIDLLRQTNTSLETIAQALFKSWFVDFDPVRAKAEGREPVGIDAATAALFPAEFEESALGVAPTGWALRTIEELADRVGMGPFGSNIKVSTFVEAGVPVLSGACLKGTLLEDDDFRYITEEHAARLAGSLVGPGDIVITHRGTLGQVSLVADGSRHRTYVLSQSQFFLRADQDVTTPEFLTYFLRSDLGQHLLLANAAQVGVPSISRPVTYLKSIRLIAPTPDVARAFSDLVTPLHRRMVSGRLRMELLSQIRDSLLPRLISCKLRLPEAKAQFEGALA